MAFYDKLSAQFFSVESLQKFLPQNGHKIKNPNIKTSNGPKIIEKRALFPLFSNKISRIESLQNSSPKIDTQNRQHQSKTSNGTKHYWEKRAAFPLFSTRNSRIKPLQKFVLKKDGVFVQ